MGQGLTNAIMAMGGGLVGFQRGEDLAADRQKAADDADWEASQRLRTTMQQAKQDRIDQKLAAVTAANPNAPGPNASNAGPIDPTVAVPVAGVPLVPNAAATPPPSFPVAMMGPVQPPPNASAAGPVMPPDPTAASPSAPAAVPGPNASAAGPVIPTPTPAPPTIMKMAPPPPAAATVAPNTTAATDPNSAYNLALAQAKAIQGEDPERAARIVQVATQQQLGNLQLSAATQKAIDDKFNAQVQALQSPQDVAQFMSASGADGNGGKSKFQVITSPDGKTVTYAKVQDDGSVVPMTGKTFTADPKGLMEAQMELMRNVPLVDKLQHAYHEETVDDTKVKNTETARHNLAEEGIAGKNADLKLQVAGMKADAAAAKNNDKGVKMDQVDVVDFQEISRQVQSINSDLAKAQAAGGFNPNDAGVKQMLATKAALELRGQAILGQYRSAPATAADPLGIRKPKTTTQTVPTPAQAPATTAVPTVAKMPPAIPEPPPPMTQSGLSMVPNPAYHDWQLQYGDAWNARQAAAKAAQDQVDAQNAARTTARMSTYNPYAQNSVR